MTTTTDTALELLTADEACQLLGGIHKATLYKGVAAGRFPAPVHIGPGTSRWIRSEVLAAIRKMMAERDGAEAA